MLGAALTTAATRQATSASALTRSRSTWSITATSPGRSRLVSVLVRRSSRATPVAPAGCSACRVRVAPASLIRRSLPERATRRRRRGSEVVEQLRARPGEARRGRAAAARAARCAPGARCRPTPAYSSASPRTCSRGRAGRAALEPARAAGHLEPPRPLVLGHVAGRRGERGAGSHRRGVAAGGDGGGCVDDPQHPGLRSRRRRHGRAAAAAAARRSDRASARSPRPCPRWRASGRARPRRPVRRHQLAHRQLRRRPVAAPPVVGEVAGRAAPSCSARATTSCSSTACRPRGKLGPSRVSSPSVPRRTPATAGRGRARRRARRCAATPPRAAAPARAAVGSRVSSSAPTTSQPSRPVDAGGGREQDADRAGRPAALRQQRPAEPAGRALGRGRRGARPRRRCRPSAPAGRPTTARRGAAPRIATSRSPSKHAPAPGAGRGGSGGRRGVAAEGERAERRGRPRSSCAELPQQVAGAALTRRPARRAPASWPAAPRRGRGPGRCRARRACGTARRPGRRRRGATTPLRVTLPSSLLTTCRCASAKAATCGRWVTTRTWWSRASRASRRPTSTAARPPTPASTSSNTMTGTGSAPAKTTSTASITRDSSPPDAPLCSGRSGAPGCGASSSSTSSTPCGPGREHPVADGQAGRRRRGR